MYDGLLIYSPHINCASVVVGAGDARVSQKDMFLPLQTDKLTGNYNVNHHHTGGVNTGILKSQSKGTEPSPGKSGITFPALKFSFIFKVNEKFWSCHINMQKCILVSNTGRISHSFFCDSMGLLLHSIMSLYHRPSFNIYFICPENSELPAGREQLFCFMVPVPTLKVDTEERKEERRNDGKEGRHCSRGRMNTLFFHYCALVLSHIQPLGPPL